MPTPFILTKSNVSNTSYINWRLKKLNYSPNYNSYDPDAEFIAIKNASNLTSTEFYQILDNCNKSSFCLYRMEDLDNNKTSIHSFAKYFGLSHLDINICADEDKLTSVTATIRKDNHEYIPYSTKRLSWHTDGYYNTPSNKINSMLLHCARPAKEGGETLLMDHEIAYILLRDENPEYIKALMQPDAMTIPANITDGTTIREAQTGPVFSITASGHLHMRYSARKRNIEWKQTPDTLNAIAFLNDLLENNSKHILRHTLKSGEGFICRNILHRRTSFVDFDEADKKRLLYRGRYYDEITNPSLSLQNSQKQGG